MLVNRVLGFESVLGVTSTSYGSTPKTLTTDEKSRTENDLPHRITSIQPPITILSPVEIPRCGRGHDPELVAVQVERVRAFVEGVD